MTDEAGFVVEEEAVAEFARQPDQVRQRLWSAQRAWLFDNTPEPMRPVVLTREEWAWLRCTWNEYIDGPYPLGPSVKDGTRLWRDVPFLVWTARGRS